MNDDLEKLLTNLEPVIDEKCRLIKKKKQEKRQSIMMFLGGIGFVSIPSIMLLLNMNLIYFLGGVIIFMMMKIFLKLPDILNKILEVRCYE